MTKKEMLKELQDLLEQKGMSRIDCGNGSVGWNSNKNEIQAAIKCLKITDEELNDYLTVFKLKYKNTYDTIITNGDWKTHFFNRYYVYSTARMILA